MKMKCKKCQQKFKVDTKEDIKCDDSKCALKYDITLEHFNFDEYKINEPVPDIIENIKSPLPYSATTYNKMTQNDWDIWCKTGKLPEDDGPICPF